MIKYGGETLHEKLKTFISNIMHQSIKSMKDNSITIFIFKRRTKTDPKNYREISLCSVITLFTEIIAKEISETRINM